MYTSNRLEVDVARRLKKPSRKFRVPAYIYIGIFIMFFNYEINGIRDVLRFNRLDSWRPRALPKYQHHF